MAKQQFNRRLSNDAIAAINWWAKQDSTLARKVTDTEIVEQAIALYNEMRAADGEVPTPRNGIAVAAIQDSVRTDPATIPGVSAGLSLKAPTGFPCRCVHSGCQGAKFTGMSKFANLCPECVESGHAGEPRNCGGCTAGLSC